MIDFGNLVPLLVARGTPLTDDDPRMAQVRAAVGADAPWREVGRLRAPRGYVGETSGAECRGVGAWALAPDSVSPPVTVLVRYTHGPEQLARLEELVAEFRREGVDVEDGRPVETLVGRGDRVEVLAAYADYADDAAAVHDARRIALGSALERGAITRACGWGEDCVVTTRGLDWTIFRTRPDGRVDVRVTQGAMDGIATHARTAMDMAQALGPGIAQAWLYREAADALACQSAFQLERELRTAYDGVAPEYSISELARRLHTDRANLSRRISKAKLRSTA